MRAITKHTSLVTALAVAALSAATAPEVRAQQEEARERTAAGMERGRAAGMKRPMMALAFDRHVGRLMDRQHELDLSDAQMSRLASLRDDAQARLAPMREDMDETREGMRDGSLTREAARTRMQALREGLSAAATELHGRLEEILEPEQRAALRRGAMRARSRGGARRSGGGYPRGGDGTARPRR